MQGNKERTKFFFIDAYKHFVENRYAFLLGSMLESLGLLGENKSVGPPVLTVLLTYDKALALKSINQFGHGILILLHLVRELLLGHGTLIPKKINEDELLRSERNIHLSELCSDELFEFAARKI